MCAGPGLEDTLAWIRAFNLVAFDLEISCIILVTTTASQQSGLYFGTDECGRRRFSASSLERCALLAKGHTCGWHVEIVEGQRVSAVLASSALKRMVQAVFRVSGTLSGSYGSVCVWGSSATKTRAYGTNLARFQRV